MSRSMHYSHVLTLAFLVFIVSGCTNRSKIDLDTPMQVELGRPGTSLETMTIRSGQMIALNMNYCPTIQLRDANGVVVRELKGGTRPQKLVASPGVYTIIGHAPTVGEWTRRIEVTE